MPDCIIKSVYEIIFVRQVFLDVIESVNLLVSTTGNVLRSEIVGSVKMRVFLSGMPELRLGLNDKILFQNTGSTRIIPSVVFLCSYGDLRRMHHCTATTRFTGVGGGGVGGATAPPKKVLIWWKFGQNPIKSGQNL